jgi:hypothetical protein
LSTAEDSPKLAWPPTKEDLQRLCVKQRLSAAKIAKIYGRNTKNPKSGAFLILYYLKKYGIERRDRVAELARTTAADVSEWASKHPPSVSGSEARMNSVPERQPDSAGAYSVGLNGEEKAVIELLRTPNLSIEHLDLETKGRIRAVIEELHLRRGISLTDVANLIGNKTSGYTSWMTGQLGTKPRDFEEARLDGIHKKVRKYERKPFDGKDEDKAYLLGISHGDFHVSRPFGDAVKVSTSSTHPAMRELFDSLFGHYGHVRHYPRYKYDTLSFEWNFEAILSGSFEFLLQRSCYGLGMGLAGRSHSTRVPGWSLGRGRQRRDLQESRSHLNQTPDTQHEHAPSGVRSPCTQGSRVHPTWATTQQA